MVCGRWRMADGEEFTIVSRFCVTISTINTTQRRFIMKNIIGLAIGVMAMIVLSGCNTTTPSDSNYGASLSYVDIYDLADGYKISGVDTSTGEDVDLCFYENYMYEYGRGTTLFEGEYEPTYSTTYGSDVINFYEPDKANRTDSYVLEVPGGIMYLDEIYYFYGLDHNNIAIESITQDFTSCQSY